jgi:hypothetical protein
MTEQPPHLRVVTDGEVNPWQAERLAAEADDRANRGATYQRGAAMCRAELRRLGLPEHGPHHQES